MIEGKVYDCVISLVFTDSCFCCVLCAMFFTALFLCAAAANGAVHIHSCESGITRRLGLGLRNTVSAVNFTEFTK